MINNRLIIVNHKSSLTLPKGHEIRPTRYGARTTPDMQLRPFAQSIHHSSSRYLYQCIPSVKTPAESLSYIMSIQSLNLYRLPVLSASALRVSPNRHSVAPTHGCWDFLLASQQYHNSFHMKILSYFRRFTIILLLFRLFSLIITIFHQYSFSFASYFVIYVNLTEVYLWREHEN